METEAPIFIVGAPRSGTTLIRNMLNRHPRIAICGETHFHRYVYCRRRAFGDLSDLKNRQRLVDEYLNLRRLQRFVTDRNRLAEKLVREATSYQDLFTIFVKYHAESQGKQRWGEKTPQHALFSETLCDWYPGGTIIHIIRDPRDVVASLQRMHWATDSVVQNARTWLECNLAALRSSVHPQYLPVHYETLIAQPGQELARICERLGEEYFPSMLEPWDQPQFPQPVSWSQRAHQPLTTERLGKWREELTSKQVAQIEWVVGRHMATFGYQPAMDPPSSLTIARGLGFAALDTVRMRFMQLPGIWYHLARPTKLAKEEFWMNHRNMKRAGMASDARF